MLDFKERKKYKMEKLIIKTNAGNFAIECETIATDYATYYSDKDEDTTFEEEYNNIKDDLTELLDWFNNNMDYNELLRKGQLVKVSDDIDIDIDRLIMDAMNRDNYTWS